MWYSIQGRVSDDCGCCAELQGCGFTSKELDDETGLYYFGARYLDPKTSRWMSVDPAGPSLANPNRGGFSMVESQNWYSYTSNNPINLIDPTGYDDVDPTEFTQGQWTMDEGFEEYFADTACAATALLNEISEQYTTENKEALSFEQGKDYMKNAIAAGGINEDDATVENWDTAANSMWEGTGLDGDWSTSSSPDATLHRIYWLDSKQKGEGGTHFINSGVDNRGTVDTFSGGKTSGTPNTNMDFGNFLNSQLHPDVSAPFGGQIFDSKRPTRDLYFRKD